MNSCASAAAETGVVTPSRACAYTGLARSDITAQNLSTATDTATQSRHKPEAQRAGPRGAQVWGPSRRRSSRRTFYSPDGPARLRALPAQPTMSRRRALFKYRTHRKRRTRSLSFFRMGRVDSRVDPLSDIGGVAPPEPFAHSAITRRVCIPQMVNPKPRSRSLSVFALLCEPSLESGCRKQTLRLSTSCGPGRELRATPMVSGYLLASRAAYRSIGSSMSSAAKLWQKGFVLPRPGHIP